MCGPKNAGIVERSASFLTAHMNTHKDTAAAIAAQVRQFYDQREPFRVYHGSTNSTRPSQRQKDRMVDISNLNQILEIDTQAKYALIEPNVPMDALVEGTLRHGMVPPVVRIPLMHSFTSRDISFSIPHILLLRHNLWHGHLFQTFLFSPDHAPETDFMARPPLLNDLSSLVSHSRKIELLRVVLGREHRFQRTFHPE